MIKQNNYSYLLLAFVLVLTISLTGCMDQFLDNSPKGSVTSKNFYKNKSDAVAAVSAAYEPLGDNKLYNFYGVMLVLENASDEAIYTGGQGGRKAIDNYTNTPLNIYLYRWWRTSFQIINRANAVTTHVPDIDMDPDQRASIVGEAKFLRAFMYFNLVRMFGRLPIRKTETDDLKNIDSPRASVDSVYAQIISDLTDAEQTLPVSYSENYQGRATAGAAKTLLAKVYLTREEWQKAADKAKEVMNSGTYSLFDDYSHAFLPAYQNGKEHIFSVQMNTGEQNAGHPSKLWTLITPSTSSTDGLSIASGGLNIGGFIVPDSSFYEAYPADHRKEVNFFTEWTFAEEDTTVTFDPHFFKYYDPNQTQVRKGNNNFSLFRYSEVLLIYAEAANEANGGPTPEAYNAINKVRQRARFDKSDSVLPDLTGLSQDGFRNAVWRERHLELTGEGKRWFDLKRTDRLIPVLSAQGKNIQEKNRLFPIPNQELQQYPEWEQNPGY